MTSIMTDVLRLFAEHPDVLHEPRPLQVCTPDRVEEAFRFVQSGRDTGNVLVDYETPGNLVQYQPATKPAYAFPTDATYLVAGGLGGLGREITRWMVSRGARHFLLLNSRGVNGSADVASFLKELDTIGVKYLAPACDCADRGAVERVPGDASAVGFPAVRGRIQGAMKLNDDAIPKMPVEKLHEALRPKRMATWNLHELLPADLDFFVLLSSFCGVFGNPGQANYAAGGTSEDAFARYRVARGQRAVSLDLALVAEAGWANDNYELVASNLRTHGGVHNDQLMALLDVVCDPAYDCAAAGIGGSGSDSSDNAQVVTIMDKPSQIYSLAEEGRIVWPAKPLFRHLLRVGETAAAGEEGGGAGGGGGGGGDREEGAIDYIGMVKTAASLEEAAEVVAQGLVLKLAKSLSVPPESPDVGEPAYVLGVDSLIAVEIRYWFAKQLFVEIPVFVIMKNQSVANLCLHAVQKILDQQATAV